MSQVVLEIPDEYLLALKIPLSKAGYEFRMLTAIKLFELERLSSGAAARFAGVPKPVFLAKLADYGIDTFSLSETELLQETRLV